MVKKSEIVNKTVAGVNVPVTTSGAANSELNSELVTKNIEEINQKFKERSIRAKIFVKQNYLARTLTRRKVINSHFHEFGLLDLTFLFSRNFINITSSELSDIGIKILRLDSTTHTKTAVISTRSK